MGLCFFGQTDEVGTGTAQNGYLFFDDLHPTAEGHALLAAAVTNSLTGTA
jgi:phospholipase/lecithinase/hemolysin